MVFARPFEFNISLSASHTFFRAGEVTSIITCKVQRDPLAVTCAYAGCGASADVRAREDGQPRSFTPHCSDGPEKRRPLQNPRKWARQSSSPVT